MVCEVQTMRESPLYPEGIGPELIDFVTTCEVWSDASFATIAAGESVLARVHARHVLTSRHAPSCVTLRYVMLRYVTSRHVTLRYVLYYALSIRCVATCAKRWGCEEAVPLRTSVCPHVGCLGGYRIHAICRRHAQSEFQRFFILCRCAGWERGYA